MFFSTSGSVKDSNGVTVCKVKGKAISLHDTKGELGQARYGMK
jgi:hypothetical protein